jgi:hypothetical protein
VVGEDLAEGELVVPRTRTRAGGALDGDGRGHALRPSSPGPRTSTRPSRPGDAGDATATFDRVAAAAGTGIAWPAGELARQRAAWLHEGIALARAEFDALADAGRALLVPHELESRILPDGVDPLKVF